ncbi:MAG: zinc-ribbon domain-containing protein, partial [Deltaproteobacteria bacterium]|nr:zinc-ribbon domain-containing protein [Deltaproteobacteria bacterium]
MKVRCEKCNAEYNIDDSRIPPEGLQIKCPKCLATFLVTKQGELPATAGDLFDIGAVDLPGSQDSGGSPGPDLSSDPGQSKSLELDLPQEPAYSSSPTTSSGSPTTSSGSSTLPSIGGGPSNAAAGIPPPSGLPKIQDAPQTTPDPTPGAEGQIFDFIDKEIGAEADAQDSGPVRFRIRRKSGKIFGPFDSETVNKMLGEHQLMGNEEASIDGHTFKPLGAFDEFADTIRALMEEPSIPEILPTGPQSSVSGVDDLDLDIDMAPKGLDFAEPPAEKVKKKGSGAGLFFLVGLLVLVLLAGIGLGFTKYGFFAYRIFTGKTGGGGKTTADGSTTGPDRSGATASQTEQLFLEDTFAGYDAVIRQLETKMKNSDETNEDLYLLALCYAAMLRNYGANDIYLGRGRNVLESLKEDEPDSPATKKAEAAFLILTNSKKAMEILAPLVKKNSIDKEALYLAGWAMAYQKKWREAAQYFDRATVIDPDLGKAYHALGDIQSLQGDFDNAMLFYEKALEKNPQHVVSAVEHARIFIEVKRDDTAGEKVLSPVFGKQFRQLAPTEKAKAHALRAKIHIHRHDNNKASQDLNAAIQLMPNKVEYMAALGNFYLDIGEYAKAKDLFQKALEKSPRNIDARIGKGRAMWQDGDIVKAKILLEKISEETKSDPRPYYLLGRIAEDLERPDQAMVLYKKAADLSSKYLTARVAIARLLLKQKKLKDALSELTAAAKINPRSAIVHNGLGEAYLLQGNDRLAQKEFEETLRLDPELASGHFNLANVLRRQSKFDAAIELYKKVAVISPRYPDLAYEHGYTLYLKKEYPESLKIFEDAIRSNPKDDRLYVRAGLVAIAIRDKTAAIQYFQSATGLNTSNTEAYFQLGLIYQQQKDHEKALELFKQVAELDSQNAEAHYRMGVCLLVQEMMTDAIDEFRLAIKLQPNHVDALIELG